MQTKPKVEELRQCVWRSDAKLIMVLFTDHCCTCSIVEHSVIQCTRTMNTRSSLRTKYQVFGKHASLVRNMSCDSTGNLTDKLSRETSSGKFCTICSLYTTVMLQNNASNVIHTSSKETTYFYVIPTLFAYFLTCHPTSFHILFLFYKFNNSSLLKLTPN